jgi:hypothetical protein
LAVVKVANTAAELLYPEWQADRVVAAPVVTDQLELTIQVILDNILPVTAHWVKVILADLVTTAAVPVTQIQVAQRQPAQLTRAAAAAVPAAKVLADTLMVLMLAVDLE